MNDGTNLQMIDLHVIDLHMTALHVVDLAIAPAPRPAVGRADRGLAKAQRATRLQAVHQERHPGALGPVQGDR